MLNLKTYSIVSYLPVIGRVRTNFFSCSANTYEIYQEQNEFERQKDIKHLGLISRVFDSSNHTRFEYLLLQCALVDMVDALNKGESQVALGSIKVGGSEYSGNAILKTWFMLSNYGQCKNTYGDSKSILLYLLQNKTTKSEFLKTIKDSSLRFCCRKIIDEFDYGRFNIVLAIYRLYNEYFNKQKKTLQLTILKLLLFDENKHPDLVKNWAKLNRLRRVFKTVRDISIISIDGHYTHTSISVDIISAISSMSDSEHAYNESYMSDTLEPLLAILNEEIYLDKDIIAMQRTYEVLAMAEIKKSAVIGDSITKAISDGLLGNIYALSPFLRLKIPLNIQPDSSLYTEFRNVQIAKKGCENVELTLDQNHYQGHRYLDVLVDHENIDRREIGIIYYRLSNLVKDQLHYLVRNQGARFIDFNHRVNDFLRDESIDEDIIKKVEELARNAIVPIVFDGLQTSISDSYRSILYSVLTYIFLDKYKIDLEHTNTRYKSFDFCIDGLTTEQFFENIETAKGVNSHDPDKVHEIEVLRKQIRGNSTDYLYVCLDRLLVLDMSTNPDKRKYTDIDGVLLFVGKTEVRLEIIEAKNTRKAVGNAKKDINKILLPALNKNRIKGYTVRPLKGKGAKLVIKF